jgi:hypothetical protein
MSGLLQHIVDLVEGTLKPFGVFGRYGIIAGMVVILLAFVNYLRQYISVRRVSNDSCI